MTLTKDDLLAFFADGLGIDTTGIGEDTLLFSASVIDSFKMVELIAFLETRCKFKFHPLDLTLDNMDSVSRILSYVGRAMAKSASKT